MQAALNRLNSGNHITTTYRTSVFAVNNSYQAVAVAHDVLENPTQFQEYLYTGIEQENANNLETADVMINDEKPETTEYSLQETQILDRLSRFSQDLDSRWKGALFSLNPNNPDATRHFCTSAREIFTEIFDSRAKDEVVFAALPNCEKTKNGKASRRSKIRYFLHKKGFVSDVVEDFIDKDMDNILELFHVLSKGTHGQAGTYSFEKLYSVKKRVEDGLIFLCDIAI